MNEINLIPHSQIPTKVPGWKEIEVPDWKKIWKPYWHEIQVIF